MWGKGGDTLSRCNATREVRPHTVWETPPPAALRLVALYWESLPAPLSLCGTVRPESCGSSPGVPRSALRLTTCLITPNLHPRTALATPPSMGATPSLRRYPSRRRLRRVRPQRVHLRRREQRLHLARLQRRAGPLHRRPLPVQRSVQLLQALGLLLPPGGCRGGSGGRVPPALTPRVAPPCPRLAHSSGHRSHRPTRTTDTADPPAAAAPRSPVLRRRTSARRGCSVPTRAATVPTTDTTAADTTTIAAAAALGEGH